MEQIEPNEQNNKQTQIQRLSPIQNSEKFFNRCRTLQFSAGTDILKEPAIILFIHQIPREQNLRICHRDNF